MSSIFDIKLSNESKFNLSFLVDAGQTKWYIGNKEQSINFLNRDLKTEIPKRKIFEVDSLIFNSVQQTEEILAQYKCFYDENSNSLSFIFNKNINFENFTKEIMLNIFDFAKKIGIQTIYFLISKKNPRYNAMVQDLKIVGFEVNRNLKSADIEGDIYKVLRLPIEEDFDEIEEIEFWGR